MKFYLVGGEIKFLTHRVEHGQEEISFYDIEKKDKFIAHLAEREITPTVTEYEQPSAELLARCEGKTFNTYEDALNFVEGKETIDTLKQQLADTDYKIIKCMEYQLAGLEVPYDIETLHTERQAIRDKINEVELLLQED